MSFSSPKIKLSLMIGLNVVVLIGHVYLLSAGFSILDERTESLTQEVQQQLRIEEQLQFYRDAPNRTQEDLDTYDALLAGMTIDQDTVDDRLTELERIATQYSVTQSLTLDVDENLAKVSFVPITINASGNIENVLSYLREIERTPFLFDVDSPSIVGGGRRSIQPRLAPGEEVDEPQPSVKLTFNAQMVWKPSE